MSNFSDQPTPKPITQEQVAVWLDACTIGNSHGATPGSELVYADRLTNVINAFIFGEERS